MDKLESRLEITSYRYTFHFFLISLIIIITYSNTFVQEWHFDDFPNIVENNAIHWKKITFNTIKDTFLRADGYGQNNLSRPLPRLTFAINYYISGLNTLSFHITNIAIHIITALFVYLVFYKTLILLIQRKDTQFTAITCQDVALLGALLWALHPLQTQAVTYIVQRMASMAAMFYIMALFFYLQGRLNGKNYKLQTVLYFGMFTACWMFAVLSKENAVLLPLSIITYELIFFGFTKKKILYIIVLLFLFAAVAGMILFFTRGSNVGSIHEMYSAVEDKIVTPYAHRPFSMFERLLTEPRILVWYLFLIICPISDFLSLESDITVSSGLFQPISTLTSILFILTLIVFSIAYNKTIKIISFSVLFFFINHIVESTFIGLELYFEHRNYLSSIFFYLVISYGLIWLYKYYINNTRVVMSNFVALFIVGILISEGNATYLRNDVWQTEETLHHDNLLKAPKNIRPRISLSSYYLRKGKFEEALIQLNAAEDIVNSGIVRVQKNWISFLYHNFGSLYYRKAEFDKSRINLLKSLEYNEYSWETHTLLGLLFFMEGDIDRSVKAYTNAVNLHFSDAKLFNMFGRALYASGDIVMALEAFYKGLELAEDQQQHNLVKTINLNIIACYLKNQDFEQAGIILNSLDKYFDDIMSRYSSYIRDETKILQKKSLNNDIIYLLCKSIIFSENNAQFLEKIVDILISSNREYCQLINEIKDNKMVGIIYPSINEIEKDLNVLYHKHMEKLIETIQLRMTTSLDCPSVVDYSAATSL